MLGFNVIYTMKPGKREEFLAEVVASGAQEACRKDEGCHQYDYFCSVDNPDLLLLVEKWESLELARKHLAQPHMKIISEISERCTEGSKLERYEL